MDLSILDAKSGPAHEHHGVAAFLQALRLVGQVGEHTYTLTAGIGDEPMWTTTTDHAAPIVHDTRNDTVSALLEDQPSLAAN
jgi:hypothetical protein